jgi:hypothetical protein
MPRLIPSLRASVLLGNERIILSTPISARPSTAVPLPSFLQPAAKRRQLILTDFPRLIAVKEESGEMKIKAESIFVVRGSPVEAAGNGGGVAAGRVIGVQEKGPRGFVLQTVSRENRGCVMACSCSDQVGQSHLYVADTVEDKTDWMREIKKNVS